MATLKQLETINNLVSAACFLGYSGFETRHHDTKIDAQLNLNGKTHFADDSSLKYFDAKIVASRYVTPLHYVIIIRSMKGSPDATFKVAVFDMVGNCNTVDYATRKEADIGYSEAFYKYANTPFAIKEARQVIDVEIKRVNRNLKMARKAMGK